MPRKSGNWLRWQIDELPLSGIELLLHLSENHPTVSLGIGEPSFDTPSHIIQAATDALKQGYTHYSPDAGLPELRAAIAEKTKKDNNFDPDPLNEVVVTAGTSPALFGAMQTLIDIGDEVIIPTPSYFAYDLVVKIFGGKSVFVSTREESGFVPDADALNEAVTSKTKMMVVCSPNNPNGSVWDRNTIKAAVDIAEDKDLVILSDELYGRIIFGNTEHFSPASIADAHERTITISGLSKSHAMAGFRIGWIIAPPQITEGFMKIHQYSSICAPVVSQKAAVAALTGPQTCVREMMEEYSRRRELMIRRINNEIPFIHAIPPKGSFFMFVNIKQLIDQHQDSMRNYLLNDGKKALSAIPSNIFNKKELVMNGSLVTMLYLALASKVLTASGTFFGPGGEGYLRLSFAQKYDLIEKGLNQLADSLGAL